MKGNDWLRDAAEEITDENGDKKFVLERAEVIGSSFDTILGTVLGDEK